MPESYIQYQFAKLPASVAGKTAGKQVLDNVKNDLSAIYKSRARQEDIIHAKLFPDYRQFC